MDITWETYTDLDIRKIGEEEVYYKDCVNPRY
jgi:hypothetical protein